jgi:CTP synthase (UTP-ammonia lyase)
MPVSWDWISTLDVDATELRSYAGIWLVPASPYRSMAGALAAVRFARESQCPFLGTCGGFQHALIETARNAASLTGADHAETRPDAPHAVIHPLVCPLVEASEQIHLAEHSRLHRAYGTLAITEAYHCRFGMNPLYRDILKTAGWDFTAANVAGDIRGGELRHHPFFVGTLFQPERRALQSARAPLVALFVRTAVERAP